jgi:predicted transcriptional regulator
MTAVKTAISLQQPLFNQVDALAGEMQISRSRLFVLAMEEFIERYQNQRLLQEINAAYKDMPEPAEQDRRRSMRHKHQQLVGGQWQDQGGGDCDGRHDGSGKHEHNTDRSRASSLSSLSSIAVRLTKRQCYTP